MVTEQVGAAWSFRYAVEVEASARFARLAERLARVGGSAAVIEASRRAASDETRHGAHCLELAHRYGQSPAEQGSGVTASEIAPSDLGLRQRVLYEVVASCCVTETISTAVLTVLLQSSPLTELRPVLRELLRDEVVHSRLGWAHLQQEHQLKQELGFLAAWIPAMLEGAASEDLYETGSAEQQDAALTHYGVLPLDLKKEVFRNSLLQVIFPAFEASNIDTVPARAWLQKRLS